jgi:hypothetical protein
MSTFERSRPTLEVGDLGAALDFLTDVVGFTPGVVEGEPPMFAIIGEGNAQIALVEVDEPALPQGAACYVTVSGLDELIGRIDAAGVDLDVALAERPWGMRDVVVTIPGEVPRVAFCEAVVR